MSGEATRTSGIIFSYVAINIWVELAGFARRCMTGGFIRFVDCGNRVDEPVDSVDMVRMQWSFVTPGDEADCSTLLILTVATSFGLWLILPLSTSGFDKYDTKSATVVGDSVVCDGSDEHCSAATARCASPGGDLVRDVGLSCTYSYSELGQLSNTKMSATNNIKTDECYRSCENLRPLLEIPTVHASYFLIMFYLAS